MIEKRPSDPVAAVKALTEHYVEHSLVNLSKEMWRHAMAISTQQLESPFGQIYSDLDVALAWQTYTLVERLQADGQIRKGVDAATLGDDIFNSTNMMFVMFTKSTEMTVKDLINQISIQNAANFRPLCLPAPHVKGL